MRLLETEKMALRSALRGVNGIAYLYGSRADPSRKGGDIDLLVLSRDGAPYRLSQDIAVRFQMECDEKIDVLVVNPDRVPRDQRPFVDLVMKDAVPFA